MHKAAFILVMTFAYVISVNSQQPNFVFIFCDDLNYLDSPVMEQAITPHLDQLKSEGVNFTNAHSNSPICGPSRASVFNGLLPHTSGYYGHSMGDNDFNLNPGFENSTTLFEHFKNNGYEVYATGKIFHKGASSEEYFTEYFNLPANHGPWPWNGTDVTSSGSQRSPHPEMPLGLDETGEGIAPLSQIPEYPMYTGWRQSNSPFLYVNDSVRDLMADEMAAEYIISQLNSNHSNPFFITAGFYRPHKPFYAPKKYFDLYPIEEIELPETLIDDLIDGSTSMLNNNANGNSGFFKYDILESISADSLDTQYWIKKHVQGYLACVSYVDEQVGKVMEAIEQSEFANNTYLIFSSDHGLHLGEKTYTKKNLLLNPSTQVPLIVSGPNVATNSIDNTPVSLVDVYPTLVDLASVPQPQQTLNGSSFKGLMENPGSGNWPGSDYVISAIGAKDETPLFSFAITENQHFSILDENFRFNLLSSGETELYDLIADPDEFNNLTHDSNYATIKSSMMNELISTIDIDQENLLETTENDALFYGGFEQKINGWRSKVAGGSSAIFEFDSVQPFNGSYSILVDVDSLLDSNAGNVQLINPCLIMEQEQLYELTFQAKTNEPSELNFLVTLNGSPNFANIISHTFSVSGDWSQYSYSFTYPEESTAYNARIKFQFINESEYWLDDVKIKKVIDTGIESLESDQTTYVYPNPTSNAILKINSEHKIQSAQLMSITGQKIDGVEVLNNTTIILPLLNPGPYFISLRTENHTITKKLIVR